MKFARPAIAVFCFIAAARLLGVAAAAWLGVGVSPVQDPLEYRLIAVNVLEHGTFSIFPAERANPDLLRGAGYPLFLAATYLLDRSGLLASALQQLLMVGAGMAAWALLRRFGAGEKTALAGSALMMLEPMQWLMSMQTRPEPLSAFLIAAAAWLALAAPGRLEFRAAAAGLALGLASLARPTTLLAAPLLVLPFLAGPAPARRRLAALAVALLAAALPLMPWVVRNHRLTGEWMLSASYGFNLVQGMGDASEYEAVREASETIADDKGRTVPNFELFAAAGHGRLRELADGLVRREGFPRLAARQIACAPDVWFGHGYDEFVTIVFGSRAAPAASLLNRLDDPVWWGILVLAVIGAAGLIRRRETRLAASSFAGALALTLTVNVCQSYSRMLVPLYPFIAVFATMGAIFAIKRLTKQQPWPTRFSPPPSSSTAPPTSS